MEYHLLTYSLFFLPVVLILYRITPAKMRWLLLLVVDFVFFWMVSGALIFYFLLATVVTYATGRALDYVTKNSGLKGKQLTRKKRVVLALGIVIPLGMLVVFKYFKLIGITLVAPIGISYYTLQTISYMTDVYRGTIKADRNIARVALYLSFFPQIMEGPITRYSEVAEALYAGRDLEFHNLVYGYQRILWGLFKKMLIADRLASIVYNVFKNYDRYDGCTIAVAVISFTIQLYMEFSGCMDIILGSAETLGIQLHENFRQPFFAENASDFWRRWHITLGTWLKDYIFYPISLAKPLKKFSKKVKGVFGIGVSKFVAPTVALFFVWLCNGIWHGAGWTYLFYGMYYFVLIFIETITEAPIQKFMEKRNIHKERFVWRFLRFVKLFIIVNIGEMFFRAQSVSQGFAMLKKILTNFRIATLFEADFGIDKYDIIIVLLGVVIVFGIDVIHEKGISIRDKISGWALPARWTFWYAAILMIIVFGAYGAGYTVVDMIYAAY